MKQKQTPVHPREKEVKKISFIIEFYEAYKKDEKMQNVAARLGVPTPTLQHWILRYPHLRRLRTEAQKRASKTPDHSLANYVYEQLSSEAKEAWEELQGIDPDDDPLEAVKDLFRTKGEKIHKEVFLHELLRNGWNQSRACKAVGVPYGRVREWCERDPEFLNLAREMLIHKKNYCEQALMSLVEERNPHAVVFVNKTLNADRGYSEKIKVEHSGEIQHTVGLYSVDDLALDLETKKKILTAIRQKKSEVIEMEEAESEKKTLPYFPRVHDVDPMV